MEGPRSGTFAATLTALLLVAGCGGTGGAPADGASDGASDAASDAAPDGASDGAPDQRSDAADAGEGTSKATDLSACVASTPDAFCLLDPPYAGVWASAPDDVWIIESDFQEITARHFDGGRWTTFAAGTSPLAGIWGSGPADVWVVGAAGAILHFDGVAFAPVASSTDADLTAVWGSGPQDIWAVGATPGSPATALTLHWDGGAWSTVACCAAIADAGPTLVAVSGSGPTDVWAVGSARATAGADPAPIAIHWDGAAWTQVAIPGSDFGLTSVASNGIDDVWFGARRQILHYDGSAFASTSILGTVTALSAGAGGQLWAVANGGGIYHLGGGAWTTSPSGTSNDLVSVAASGAADAWAVGPAGTVLNWSGDTWTPLTDGTIGPLGAVSGSGADAVWTSGPLRWDGVGWSHDDAASSIVATGLCGFAADDFWAVGQTLAAGGGDGFVAHFDGEAWTIDGIEGIYVPTSTAEPSLGPSSMNAIWCHTPSDVWAVGQITAITGPVQDTVAHWDGHLWSPIDVPTTQFLAGVWGSAANDIWAAGGVGTLIHWDGQSWTSVASNVTDDLGAVWGSGPHDVWVTVARQPRFLHWDGSVLTTVADGTSGFGMTSIWGAGPADAWAVGGDDVSGGAAVHWDGDTWSTVWSVPPSVGKLTGVWGSGSSLFVVAGDGMIFARR